MTHILVAIPGQPTEHYPMPDGAPEQALAAIKTLAASEAATRLFGFLTPRLRASYYAPWAQLSVLCDCHLTRNSTTSIVVEWRRGRLWQSDHWYEVGWHPSTCFDALDARWQRRLWDALNPGKRPTNA